MPFTGSLSIESTLQVKYLELKKYPPSNTISQGLHVNVISTIIDYISPTQYRLLEFNLFD